MAHVEVTGTFPGLDVVGVLWTPGTRGQVLWRLVARVGDRIRDAIADPVAEAFLSGNVHAVIARRADRVTPLDVREIRIGSDAVSVQRLIEVAQHRDVAAEVADEVG